MGGPGFLSRASAWAPLLTFLLFSCSLDRGALSFGDAGTPDGGGGLVCPPGYEDANGDPSDGCECQFIAEMDVCNGLDDDCDPTSADGSEDESLGAACDGRDDDFCSNGTTGCGPDGTVTCMGDVATPELCDDTLGDENCNGTVDEGCACTGSETRPCGLSEGACMEGVQTCVGGTWSDCEGGVDPIDELCNGADDNCNGMIDEPFPTLGASCVVGDGVCRRMGRNVCNGAMDGVTCSEMPGTPSDEQCNGMDDDCDAMVDETFTDLGDACTVGTGACARSGTRICNARGTGTRCSATAGSAGSETCNGMDDDCDGMTDEGLGLGDACTEGTGDCERSGSVVCASGGGTECDATPGAAGSEACGGGDEDCDGNTDEGFMLGTSCMVGTGDCQATGMIVCDGASSTRCNATEGTAGTEVCGGGDEDCDGNTDEVSESCTTNGCSGTRPCGGMCTPDAGEVEAEICDDADQDCDGMVDEDFDIGDACVDGLCAGTWACAPGGGRTCIAISGGSESCNAEDDDCDGNIDESDACGSSCSVVGSFGGSIYLACTNQGTLDEAEAWCATRGGPWRIASLETNEEVTEVYAMVSSINSRWWVGLRATGDDWVWESGADAPDSGTPPWRSDPDPGETCGHLRSGELDDEPCDTDRRVICEAPAP